VVISILGSGLMGSEIAIDIVAYKKIDEVIVVDSNASRLEELKKKAKQRLPDSLSAKLSTHKCDIISNKEELLKILKRSDVAIGALPHSVADIAVASAIEAAINYVDLIYSWRASNSYADVDKKAKNENITIIPACGLAPGLSNIIARKAVEDIRGEADELTIYVGGIPEKPEPPLEYKIVFSPDSVIEEYTREALVVRNGKIAMLPALSEVEEVTFTSVSGKFEAFVTDGLSTLPNTVKAFNMTEKTVRWIGHAEKIRMLSELGLFSEEEIDIGDKCKISPRKVMSRLLADRLAMKGEDRDMTLLKVVAKKGEKQSVYEMVDRYDGKTHTTSMARTTSFPASIVAQFLLEGRIKRKGFLPPEEAIDSKLFDEFLYALKQKSINITKTV
jgi:lysine 6-dehydrogenase